MVAINRYCVMIDRYTRWPNATPVQDVSTEKVADAVGNTWVARFGASKTIIRLDQGT